MFVCLASTDSIFIFFGLYYPLAPVVLTTVNKVERQGKKWGAKIVLFTVFRSSGPTEVTNQIRHKLYCTYWCIKKSTLLKMGIKELF